MKTGVNRRLIASFFIGITDENLLQRGSSLVPLNILQNNLVQFLRPFSAIEGKLSVR